ncbi:disease resistance protein (TIR-NBS-LRR class) [Trifolium pratense]|uniref:Disease resistance protein (TIR-NBS-LRR class) n=1 Tax=Trifolium pratense TaxID=57577 RepID=A0A2K3PBI6_TRIPR|nr:disease resistance protein (TIR-NBS-LRR class) [Trifolium pratense]
MKDVESEKKKLILNRGLVQEKIGTTPKTEKVNNAVFEWLKESEKLIEDEENLKTRTEAEIPDYDCSFAVVQWVLCSNHEMRYGMYNEMLKKMKVLNTNSEPEPFSTTIPALEYFSSGYFVSFEPMKEASDRLIVALQDNNCSIIGLYGKRGSGKTKLVKIVGEKAKYLNIFDVILFANVSKNPNAMRIQDEIADSLNLKFKRNTEVARARTISSELESIGRVLVILDDVQEKIELEDIGIPNDGSNGCKVLLTTRRQRECGLMDCQSQIPLGPLSNDEAWVLLKKYSGIEDEPSSDILNVAHQIVFECEMLPGTIKEVGSSLKSKPVVEWKVSLDNLRHPMARWQIFISFRGKDTRYSFTGFLYDALCQGGFKTFMDDGGGLHNGDQISPSLYNAIEASRLSIVVLSENYASSSWCLDELAKILECKQLKNQLVWPIFYKVQPSDIRDLKNNYGVSMTNHEQELGSDSERLQKWRSALSEVSGLSGQTYKTDGCVVYTFIY